MSDTAAADQNDSNDQNDSADPNDHDDSDVQIARRFLRRSQIRDVSFLTAGLLLLAAGITGFIWSAVVSNHLSDTGVRATATAVATHTNGVPFHLDDQIEVTFRAKGNKVIVARCYTTSADQFTQGQPVVIVYDGQNPARAQLADNPDLGPQAAPLTLAVLMGVLLATPAATAMYNRRGAQTTLKTKSTKMTATKYKRTQMSLRHPNTQYDTLEIKIKGQKRHFPQEPTSVKVFNPKNPKTPIIIVTKTPNQGVATARKPKPPPS